MTGWRGRLGSRAIGRGLIAVATLVAVLAPSAQAQDYPTRAVKIIVPFPAGGSADVVPRIVAEWLSRKWGQPVVIENRPGAGGNIGAELAYDPTQFEKIAVLVRIPNSLVVTPKFPPRSVAEVITYAKANPGKINSATQGNGTTSHLTSEMFQVLAGVQFQHVPYTGTAPALNDLVAGSVDVMFDNLGVSLQLVNGDKLRLLAVASPKRMASLPNVPTIAETLPGFESEAFYAIVAPPKTPVAIVNKINADINEALRQSELAPRFAALSAEIVGGTPRETVDYMQAEVERWNKVIKAANVKLQ